MIYKVQRHKIFYDLKGKASQDILWFKGTGSQDFLWFKDTASQDFLWFERHSVTRFFMIWKAQRHKIFYDLKGKVSQDIFMI